MLLIHLNSNRDGDDDDYYSVFYCRVLKVRRKAAALDFWNVTKPSERGTGGVNAQGLGDL